MEKEFLIYGANGFVGGEIAKHAVLAGLHPIIAGRNQERVNKIAKELNTDFRVFDLNEPDTINQAIIDTNLVLNCAGPFIHTYQPILQACLQTGTHYLDISGEIPVYAALCKMDELARQAQIMLMPGVGFDILPSDCLAVYLKHRLPTANRLTIAFQNDGPAGLPPGTARTMVEMARYGTKIRVNSRLKTAFPGLKTRQIDFGDGPVEAARLSWGDVFTAFYSTGIPNIEDYSAVTAEFKNQMMIGEYLRPLFWLPAFRNYVLSRFKVGSSEVERSLTRTVLWGEVEDLDGRKAEARLVGPEAGVTWTTIAAISAVKKVLAGMATPGFQTPGKIFGADIVLEDERVQRVDILN
jgi:short subunit dehydrogenase-like uncharacterized protein